MTVTIKGKRELKPGVKKRLAELQRLSRRDETFMALVDMYRNVACEDEVASYWMAYRDYREHGGLKGKFVAHKVGYDEREMGFLKARGIVKTGTVKRRATGGRKGTPR